MQAREMDYLLARHCAPTLLGLKPANLFAVPTAERPSVLRYLQDFGSSCRPWPLEACVVAEHGKHVHILFYQASRLARLIALPQAQRILSAAAYPQGASLEDCLALLRRRWTKDQELPHELGLFLGYPAADVAAFISHHGKGAQVSGYWQAYHHPEEARRIFRCYDQGRNCLLRHVASGAPLAGLFGWSEDLVQTRNLLVQTGV